MKKLLRTALAAATLGVAIIDPLTCAAQGHGTPDGARLRAASYNGVWTGTVKCLHDPGIWPDDDCDIGLRLDIADKVLRIRETTRSRKGQETPSDLDPAKFRFAVLGTNAVAVSMDSGSDEDGTWVETWSFVMTLKDPDHMIVHWNRVVNNVDLPASAKGSKFSIVGMGELSRASPGGK